MASQRGFPAAVGSAKFFSEDARQRDLLPLPHLGSPSGRTCLAHLGRGTRQRVSRRHATEDRCNNACSAVNVLACGIGCRASVKPVTEAQAAAHRVVEEAVGCYPPPAELLSPDEALRLLLHTGGECDAVAATGALAPFGSGELSLPSDASRAPSLIAMLEAADAQIFEGFREHLLLPEADHQVLLHAEGVPGLYFDPVLKHHRGKYLGLLEQMNSRGLLYWKRAVEESVGLFCVTKKSGALRLIADARRSNACFRKPRGITLATAEGCSRFELGASGQFFGAGLDLKDYFHTLRISEDLANFFGLPPIRGGRA